MSLFGLHAFYGALFARLARLGASTLILTVLFMALAGCAGKWVDPGPIPARIEVAVEARVSQERVDNTVAINHLVPPITLPGMWHQVRGPFWDWGLYLQRPNGTFDRLRPEQPEETLRGAGRELVRKVTFEAPEGELKLRLMVECYMEHTWVEDMPGGNVEAVPVVSYYEDYRFNLQAGERTRIERVFEEKAK